MLLNAENKFNNNDTPLESDKFNKKYKEMVDLGVNSISMLCEAEDRPISPIREKEVSAAMKRLKTTSQWMSWA